MYIYTYIYIYIERERLSMNNNINMNIMIINIAPRHGAGRSPGRAANEARSLSFFLTDSSHDLVHLPGQLRRLLDSRLVERACRTYCFVVSALRINPQCFASSLVVYLNVAQENPRERAVA